MTALMVCISFWAMVISMAFGAWPAAMVWGFCLGLSMTIAWQGVDDE